MEIRFTLRAEKDLQSIYEYFAEVAPHKVSDVLNAIVDRTSILLIHPEAGPFEPLLHSMDLTIGFLWKGIIKLSIPLMAKRFLSSRFSMPVKTLKKW